jgi:putative heme-binding domain-containing protein
VLLDHADGWHRDTASRLLYQRQDREAVEPLRQLATAAKTAQGRVHALYALSGLGALDARAVVAALNDADPHVRVHALRLAEPLCSDDVRLEHRLVAMTAADDPLVRYQLAFSLGALPESKPASAIAALAVRDGASPWVSTALLSSSSRCAGAVFRTLADDAGFRGTQHGRALLAALVGQTGMAGLPEQLAVVLETLEGPLAGDRPLARSIVLALLSVSTAASQVRLEGPAAAIMAEILAESSATAADPKKPAAARTAAIRALRFSPFDDVRALLAGLLVSQQRPDLQSTAIDTLARFDDDRVASIVLEAWPGFSPKLRATAAEALFSRPKWIAALLDAVERGSIGRGDVDPARLELLKSDPDPGVRKRAERIVAEALHARQDVVAGYQRALQLPGEPQRGKALFKTHCSSCHRLESVGESVGADLTAIRDRGVESVLLNILDPNREVKPQYQSYVVVTTSGRIVTGMITAESANSLTIRRPDAGEETLLRLQVEELRSTGLSYMPEGLEKQIDVAAMADLLAYLNSVH